MLIKSADDKRADIDALMALLDHPEIDARTRENIEQEIRAIRAGAKGEHDAAYEIEFAYADSPYVATIHDLRIECGGRTAQIDHLIINRILQIWVCESKHFAEGVWIDDNGEWERSVGGRRVGMASPVEQNKKHIAVLEDVFRKGLVALPKRLGHAVRPELRSLILVSNRARIRRPRATVAGLETVIKCDQLGTTIERQLEGEGVFGLLGKAAVKLISPDDLADVAHRLAALHTPAQIDWASRFGIPAEPPAPIPVVSSTQPGARVPEDTAPQVERRTFDHSVPTPAAFAALAEEVDHPPSLAGSPERLLADLNASQIEAVQATHGPLAILAGAGSGKTRVVSRRAAYAIETGVVPADQILLVTFTDKAAGEMVERMAALGHPGVMARTFHAMALAQLGYFWPSRHGGSPPPEVLASKARLIVPLIRALPGHYRFTPAKDIAGAIEWAKVRRIAPSGWIAEGGAHAPLPPDLFARLYADYERAKRASNLLDFEDLLVEAVELLETDADAAAIIRARKSWISVDEYQDTNPLAERLLELWLGESRDLAVVGDPDQTIYTFAGATPEYLLRFAARHPGARTVTLADNYRSSPQVLAIANRLVGEGPRGALRATRPDGPRPSIRRYADDEAERAALIGGIRRLIADGVAPAEIAILVRVNAQLPPMEEALTRAAIGYQVAGVRFFDRAEVRDARRRLGRSRLTATGPALLNAARTLFERDLGLSPEEANPGPEARERDASLELLLSILDELVEANGGVGMDAYIAELDRRAAAEAASGADGVHLLTYHRAKGLEWDAVFLPALEEGLLPIRYAKDDEEVAEERRLLYVGITRARVHLALSWAERRSARDGKEGARRPSRFLAALEDRRPVQAAVRRTTAGEDAAGGAEVDRHLLEALQLWRRRRAQADDVPAYVVAHDATLREIARARPGSPGALGQVKGMGPVKVERYGAEILAVVRRFPNP